MQNVNSKENNTKLRNPKEAKKQKRSNLSNLFPYSKAKNSKKNKKKSFLKIGQFNSSKSRLTQKAKKRRDSQRLPLSTSS